jgi:hypothetical protein
MRKWLADQSHQRDGAEAVSEQERGGRQQKGSEGGSFLETETKSLTLQASSPAAGSSVGWKPTASQTIELPFHHGRPIP